MASPTPEAWAGPAYEAELLSCCRSSWIKLQASLQKRGERLVVLFEGRDAAGKGSTIKRFMRPSQPAPGAQAVALSKPTEVEAGDRTSSAMCRICRRQGDIVLFDRSWSNRAGVEQVMGFCTGPTSSPTSCARRRNSRACSHATASTFSSSISILVGKCN